MHVFEVIAVCVCLHCLINACKQLLKCIKKGMNKSQYVVGEYKKKRLFIISRHVIQK